ncbi:HNH endonuclease [Planctomycetota bacterium]
MGKARSTDEPLGPCPLCGRPMASGPSLNKHHLTPKTFGGREIRWIHRVCHAKIHSLFTERELQKEFDSFERLREYPEIRKFIAWVRKKPSDFYIQHRAAGRKRGRRR